MCIFIYHLINEAINQGVEMTNCERGTYAQIYNEALDWEGQEEDGEEREDMDVYDTL